MDAYLTGGISALRARAQVHSLSRCPPGMLYSPQEATEKPYTGLHRGDTERNKVILQDILCALCEPLCRVFRYAPSTTTVLVILRSVATKNLLCGRSVFV
jgi:hypothetical protein